MTFKCSTRTSRTPGTVRSQCAVLRNRDKAILTMHVCITDTRGFWIVCSIPAKLVGKAYTRVLWRTA